MKYLSKYLVTFLLVLVMNSTAGMSACPSGTKPGSGKCTLKNTETLEGSPSGEYKCKQAPNGGLWFCRFTCLCLYDEVPAGCTETDPGSPRCDYQDEYTDELTGATLPDVRKKGKDKCAALCAANAKNDKTNPKRACCIGAVKPNPGNVTPITDAQTLFGK